MVQCRSNTEKLEDYVKEHEEYFRSVDKDTYNVIVELLHSKSKLKNALKEVDTKKREEPVDVCKAIDGIYENGYNKGKEEMLELVKKAEAEKQKAEAEKEQAQNTLKEAAERLLATMDKEVVAELLGLELTIVNQLESAKPNNKYFK